MLCQASMPNSRPVVAGPRISPTLPPTPYTDRAKPRRSAKRLDSDAMAGRCQREEEAATIAIPERTVTYPGADPTTSQPIPKPPMQRVITRPQYRLSRSIATPPGRSIRPATTSCTAAMEVVCRLERAKVSRMLGNNTRRLCWKAWNSVWEPEIPVRMKPRFPRRSPVWPP